MRVFLNHEAIGALWVDTKGEGAGESRKEWFEGADEGIIVERRTKIVTSRVL